MLDQIFSRTPKLLEHATQEAQVLAGSEHITPELVLACAIAIVAADFQMHLSSALSGTYPCRILMDDPIGSGEKP